MLQYGKFYGITFILFFSGVSHNLLPKQKQTLDMILLRDPLIEDLRIDLHAQYASHMQDYLEFVSLLPETGYLGLTKNRSKPLFHYLDGEMVAINHDNLRIKWPNRRGRR